MTNYIVKLLVKVVMEVEMSKLSEQQVVVYVC